MRRRLRSWFRSNRRHLPWREEPRDPYIVLVAEMMLQQTQVWRVEPILPRFIEQFPSTEALARASQAEVIVAWRGLGYNRRAVQLHRCAQEIVCRHGGSIPSDQQVLRSLPGIGAYTAGAICAFAFGQDVAVVDVNIQRVLSRFVEPQPTEADMLPRRRVQVLADFLLPRGGGIWWNEALMDLGSLLCRPRLPHCAECPLEPRCASAGRMAPAKPLQKIEPVYRGIPRRLWRGRLIELLRHRSPRLISDCASALFSNPTDTDLGWLHTLLQHLHRDGLICLTDSGMVALSGDALAPTPTAPAAGN